MNNKACMKLICFTLNGVSVFKCAVTESDLSNAFIGFNS